MNSTGRPNVIGPVRGGVCSSGCRLRSSDEPSSACLLQFVGGAPANDRPRFLLLSGATSAALLVALFLFVARAQRTRTLGDH